MATPKLHNSFRKYHRWLGFFLAGIMSVYAISGILLIFRKTDFMKFPQNEVRQLAPSLQADTLGDELRLKGFKVSSESDELIVFNVGEYNKITGVASISQLGYPLILAKLVTLHKATPNSPLFFLNISFGIALLFFVISAFMMFMPKLPLFKSSLKIAAAGAIFALLVVVFAS